MYLHRSYPFQNGIQEPVGAARGIETFTTRNLNATPLELLSTSGVRDQAAIDYLSAPIVSSTQVNYPRRVQMMAKFLF